MTLQLKTNYDALLRWSRYLDEVPKRTRPAIARALNDYGRGVAESKAQSIAAELGLDPHDVRNMIDVEEATPDHLFWKMDATAIAKRSPDEWERPWAKRDSKAFEGPTLVKIVTSGDDRTCEICAEAALKSPYTMDEINALAARWKHWEPEAGGGAMTNLLHPRCRCFTQPWQQTRRLGVRFGAKGAPEELMNARQLGRRVADELKVTIRAVKL